MNWQALEVRGLALEAYANNLNGWLVDVLRLDGVVSVDQDSLTWLDEQKGAGTTAFYLIGVEPLRKSLGEQDCGFTVEAYAARWRPGYGGRLALRETREAGVIKGRCSLVQESVPLEVDQVLDNFPVLRHKYWVKLRKYTLSEALKFGDSLRTEELKDRKANLGILEIDAQDIAYFAPLSLVCFLSHMLILILHLREVVLRRFSAPGTEPLSSFSSWIGAADTSAGRFASVVTLVVLPAIGGALPIWRLTLWSLPVALICGCLIGILGWKLTVLGRQIGKLVV